MRCSRDLLHDIEAALIGVICAYEAIAICLRKTRWTDRVPPITRVVAPRPLLEIAVCEGLRWHFRRHRRASR